MGSDNRGMLKRQKKKKFEEKEERKWLSKAELEATAEGTDDLCFISTITKAKKDSQSRKEEVEEPLEGRAQWNISEKEGERERE